MKSRYVEILKILANGPLPGMYANDIVRVSSDVSISTVYTDLEMLEAGGFIEEHEGEQTPSGPRIRHVITPKGRLAIEDELS